MPSFDNCFWDPFVPRDAIGQKQWDIAAEKAWTIGEDMRFRVRADILNVMNWRTFTDFETWRGGPGDNDANPNFGRRNGLGTAWPPRMFKLTAGFSW